MRPTKLISSAAVSLVVLSIGTAPASAATVRYEAEDYLPVGGSYSVVKSSAASRGKYLQINSGGAVLDVPVFSQISLVKVQAKGQACAAPRQVVDQAILQTSGIPSYAAQESLFTAGRQTISSPSFASHPTSVVGQTGAVYSAANAFHPDASHIKVSFTNDYVGATCDRNLLIDFIDVVTS